jgi:hypothetical protein
VRRSQSMAQEEDRGQPADDELKDGAAPKSRLAEQSGGPSGKSRSLGSVRRRARSRCRF